MTSPWLNIILISEKLKAFPLRSREDKDSVQYWKFSLQQLDKEKKRNPNWKGRNIPVTVCRWHDIIDKELKMPPEN